MDYIYQGPVILVLLVSNDAGGHCAIQHNSIMFTFILFIYFFFYNHLAVTQDL